ncbi:replication factor C, subunit 2, putative [Trypanosoma equiperdum]|uniref:Replication factor C, subunit 2, putative n=4 Tax=Trypanozoon TaxID=39700 RepID=Q585Y7_TRYB2|nr:replication factor C, subunit 2, putative [Trypanosoma brucei gambiense DAL972]XP_845507.1 replication factor C, subunit 2, putative [Trypanosoma brucei brucei TREU927]AAX80776.1 replication factor C, subunit 2, putative [Trypanosoma brucei]RHW71957.1 replication factor C [Trypanosoma brucei equiperdum]SCU68122.1 replication factor C, subunit 2, putative [Trypanosoma equiperdum]AAZ11948.1 replication factor C, subunit 2, putative [Trypanosoma brucei brucei TREU927]CBH11889.1 replication fa|eukprot:XP_011774174.1 replication factor C, subunit 2, putative [Trypanosoma brucei gambiense DAL972]
MLPDPPLKKHRVEPSVDLRPWIEKYRPKSLDEVKSQEEVVQALRSTLRQGASMPHFLFHGPPGTGKTTAILAVAHELFGPDYIKSRVRELNASDDRGIQVIREKVKSFAQTAVGNVVQKVQSDGKIYPVPPFKVIILDEADALLPDAQAALRRMMEDFSDVTRFCILCNYVTRIIDPIASRCAKYRFKPLIKEALYERISEVASRENIQISRSSIDALDHVSGGDLRLAIMYLQYAQRANGNDLQKEDFVEVSGSVPASMMQTYLAALMMKSFDEVRSVTKRLVQQGYPACQILAQLQDYIVSAACPLNSAQRGSIALKLCDIEKRLSDGCDDFVQLLELGSFICSV